MRTCKVEGCERTVYGHGFCSMHWKRWWKHGDPLIREIRKSPQERFEQFIMPVPEAGCFIWMGNGDRYGNFHVSPGNRIKAHRFSYELYIGPIPAGLDVCHKCDTPLCVNPRHLFLGTRQDNMQDCVKKGRTARGEKVPHSKLTQPQIIAIRNDVRRHHLIAQDYGMVRSTISAIKKRIIWTHV